MDFDLTVVEADRHMRVTVTGRPSIEQLVSLIHLLGVRSSTWKLDVVLVDLRGVATDFSPAEQFRIGMEAASSLPHLRKIASVVPATRITRISEKAARRDGTNVTVFTDEGEALAWLHEAFDLDRFVQAQHGVIDTVRAELRAGRKRTHWMWFVFPQLAGLGTSAVAQRYGIRSLAEARAYLAHEVLGARLRECCFLMLGTPDRSAFEILGSPDDMKFRSCLTLFEQADARDLLFREGLVRFYGGEADPQTLRLLAPDDVTAPPPA